MFCCMIAIWLMEYFIRIDVERHQNQLFETSEFTVEIWNLPPLHEEYSAEILKSDLHKLIMDQITDSDQIISRLEDTPNKQNCEIVEIQIAFSNYKSLLHVVEMQNQISRIQQCDMNIKMEQKGRNFNKVSVLKGDKQDLMDKVLQERIQFYETLRKIDS